MEPVHSDHGRAVYQPERRTVHGPERDECCSVSADASSDHHSSGENASVHQCLWADRVPGSVTDLYAVADDHVCGLYDPAVEGISAGKGQCSDRYSALYPSVCASGKLSMRTLQSDTWIFALKSAILVAIKGGWPESEGGNSYDVGRVG